MSLESLRISESILTFGSASSSSNVLSNGMGDSSPNELGFENVSYEDLHPVVFETIEKPDENP